MYCIISIDLLCLSITCIREGKKNWTIEKSMPISDNWQSSWAAVCKLPLALYSNCQAFGVKGTIKCHLAKMQEQTNRMCRPGSAVLSGRDRAFFPLILKQLEDLLSITGCQLPPFCNEHLCPPIVYIIKDPHKLCSVRVTYLHSHSLSSFLAFSCAPSGRCVRRSRRGFSGGWGHLSEQVWVRVLTPGSSGSAECAQRNEGS